MTNLLLHTIRNIIIAISFLIIAPLAFPELGLRALFGRDMWFLAQSQFLSLIPGKFGSYIRNAYYFMLLKNCPLDCYFAFGMTFSHSNVSVGHRVYIGSHSMIGMASIGDDSMISDHVHILSGGHQHGTLNSGVPFQKQQQRFSAVTIANNVWIGTRCVIMGDIGSDTIIGAGSVVTKPLPGSCLAAGVPARIIRQT
jgi:virginiamycin A acetyltransferase